MSTSQQAIDCKNEGDQLYKEKKYQVAVMKYTQAINLLHPQGLTPTDDTTFQTLYVSYSNRCACFLQTNRLDQALHDAKQCVKLKPDWPKGYSRLAACHHKMGHVNDAIKAYEQVLRLDPSNEDAKRSLERLRNPSYGSGSNSGSTHNNNNNGNNGVPGQPFDWQRALRTAQQQLSSIVSRAMIWWQSLSPETQNYIKIGLVVLVIYYFFFSRSSSMDYEYYDAGRHYYHSSPSYYGGGMSWTTWALIMLGAYTIPPMLPEQLGPMYARPFFGMNWTTFMWLLNMVSRNAGGFGGGFGGRPMFGGAYGRRRYY